MKTLVYSDLMPWICFKTSILWDSQTLLHSVLLLSCLSSRAIWSTTSPVPLFSQGSLCPSTPHLLQIWPNSHAAVKTTWLVHSAMTISVPQMCHAASSFFFILQASVVLLPLWLLPPTPFGFSSLMSIPSAAYDSLLLQFQFKSLLKLVGLCLSLPLNKVHKARARLSLFRVLHITPA